MSSKARKLLALFLCLTLCLGLLPAAYASEAGLGEGDAAAYLSEDTAPAPSPSVEEIQENPGAAEQPGVSSPNDAEMPAVEQGDEESAQAPSDEPADMPPSTETFGDDTPPFLESDVESEDEGGEDAPPSPAPIEPDGEDESEAQQPAPEGEDESWQQLSADADEESTTSAEIAEDEKQEPEDEEEEILVRVSFQAEDAEALAFLTVTDAAGQRVQPTVSAETGEPQYGSYLLSPGEYSYRFHDENEKYDDLEERFTVGDVETQVFYLALKPVAEGMSFSLTYINPIYDGVVSASDIPDVPVSPEESLERMQSAAEPVQSVSALGGPRKARAFMAAASSGPVMHTDVQSAAADLRSQICSFETTATIRLVTDTEPTEAMWSSLCVQIFSAAIAHTGVSTQGDYIRYEYGGYKANGSIAAANGQYNCEFIYSLYHYTTAEQEAELTPVVNGILGGLGLEGKSAYEKVQAIYGYLCDNVSYGGSGDLQFTAYAALVQKRAVCQGIATAFYRLCLESGVDARIVTSSAMGHAWNIAQVDGAYYALDATWDIGYKPASYRFFLRGSSYWLSNHKNGGGSVIGDEFTNGSFAGAYYFPAYDYAEAVASEARLAQEKAFPDKSFREYAVGSFDADRDGILSEVELAAVTVIDLSGLDTVATLQGLELFPALTSLNCAGNQLAELDLSANTALTVLNCSGNRLTALDVSMLSGLRSLDCSFNPLSAVNLPDTSNFETYIINGTGISSFDLSRFPRILRLGVCVDAVTQLDVSGSPALIAAVNAGARDYVLPNGQTARAYGGSGSDYVLLVPQSASVSTGGSFITLTYDPNGGVGGPEPVKCSPGDRLTLSTVEPTRDGYLFLGWALTRDAATAAGKPGTGCTMGDTDVVIYAVWSPLVTGVVITGAADGAAIDMAQSSSIHLDAVATPGGAAAKVTWRANPASVATVDASGNVSFLRPGTVTVTATDSANKSASVRLTVYYLDTASRLTASLSPVSTTFGAATSAGLQAGDTAAIQIYGTDKNTPLNAPFDYTISTGGGSQYLRLGSDGTVAALLGGKTVTVRAALRGDPLKRSVSLNIKTLTPQISSVTLSTTQGADRLLMSPADQVITLRPSAVNALGAPITVQRGMFTYRVTDGSRVVSVRENADGTAAVTVRRNQSGAFTVTATAKDATKATCSWSGTVINYTPMLSANQVSVDSYHGGAASVNIVFQYGNALNGSVRFYDNNKRQANSYNIQASAVDNGNGTVTVTLTPRDLLPNRTFTGQLYVPTLNGDYWLDLRLVSRNTLPSVSVRQLTRFNLFYRDSEALFDVTVSGAGVKNVTLQSDVFEGIWQSGRLTVRYKSGLGSLSTKINTRATLLVEADGYNFPVAKTVTISTVSTKPSYRLDVTSGTFNTAFGGSGITLHLLPLNGSPAITAQTGFAPGAGLSSVRYENGAVVLTPLIASGRLTFYVQQANWAMPLSFNYTLKSTTTAPRLTPVSSTLSLNGSAVGSSAATPLKSNQTNTDLNGISGTLSTTAAAAKGKLSVVCTNGVITATVLDSSVKAGSYVFSFTPSYNGRAAATVKVTVRVVR